MSIPKEPRQQMINIMYLVLIALLALSVSAEILNAFKIVNEGIDNSNNAIQQQIDATILGFEEKIKKEPEAQKYFDAAKKASEITAEFTAYVEELDGSLLDESGVDEATGDFVKPDDQDTPSRIMVGNNGNGKGYELKDKIEAAREKYVALFDAFKADKGNQQDMDYLNNSMPLRADEAEDQEGTGKVLGLGKKDWVEYNFYQIPVIGASTLLNQIKNNAIASEAMVVQRLSERAGVKPKVTFNQMKPVVIPNSKKVVEGEPFTMELFVAATSAKSKPTITVGGQALNVGNNGAATYRTTAQGIGTKTVSGSMTVLNAKGEPENLSFSTSYEVLPRPEKLNEQPMVPKAELDRAIQKIRELEEEIRRLKEELAKRPPISKTEPVVPKIELDKALKRIKELEEELKRRPKTPQGPTVPKDEFDRIKAQLQEAENQIKQYQADNTKAVVKDLQDKVYKYEQEIAELKKREKQQKVIKEQEPDRKPTGVVKADKMNVFYIGVDNPISLAVSGVNLDIVDASITKGKMKKIGRGKHLVRVPNQPGSKTTVSMSAKGTPFGSNEFRIKKIPDPVPKLGNQAGGKMGTGAMKAQQGLRAVLENFDFDAKFNVLSYEVTLAKPRADLLVRRNEGPRFSADVKDLLNQVEVGSIIYFDEIKVKGPDKTTRKLPSISFQVR